MEIVDDRTEEQKKTHYWIVLGTDRFLSGWGRAVGGKSYAGWACKPGDFSKVDSWVRSRGDMDRVRLVSFGYRPKSAYCKHYHIYVVNDGHPALC